MSGELLLQIVEAEGKTILAVSTNEQLELDWSAKDCVVTTPEGKEVSRLYDSADGVLIPTTTAAEKRKRRATVLKTRSKMLTRFVDKLAPLSKQLAGPILVLD